MNSETQNDQLEQPKTREVTPEELRLRNMKPTQRWVETAPIETCIAEYELIKMKTSNCSSAQRKYIQERVEKHLANQK